MFCWNKNWNFTKQGIGMPLEGGDAISDKGDQYRYIMYISPRQEIQKHLI